MGKTVNLSELATIVGEDIRRTLPAERTIEYVVQPGLGARGDARLLRVVLHHLVENAAKFTRSSAKARITVGSKGPDTDPAFFVADNGIGFDMRHAATPWRDALLQAAALTAPPNDNIPPSRSHVGRCRRRRHCRGARWTATCDTESRAPRGTCA